MCTHVIRSVCVCLNHYIRGPIIISQEKLSGTERVLLTYRVAYSQLTHFRTHFCWMKGGRGQSLHTEEEVMFCHFKTCSEKMDQWSM